MSRFASGSRAYSSASRLSMLVEPSSRRLSFVGDLPSQTASESAAMVCLHRRMIKNLPWLMSMSQSRMRSIISPLRALRTSTGICRANTSVRMPFMSVVSALSHQMEVALTCACER